MNCLKLLSVLFVCTLLTVKFSHGENAAAKEYTPDIINPESNFNTGDLIKTKRRLPPTAVNPMKLIAPSVPTIRKPGSFDEDAKSKNWITPSGISPDKGSNLSAAGLSQTNEGRMQELLTELGDARQGRNTDSNNDLLSFKPSIEPSGSLLEDRENQSSFQDKRGDFSTTLRSEESDKSLSLDAAIRFSSFNDISASETTEEEGQALSSSANMMRKISEKWQRKTRSPLDRLISPQKNTEIKAASDEANSLPLSTGTAILKPSIKPVGFNRIIQQPTELGRQEFSHEATNLSIENQGSQVSGLRPNSFATNNFKQKKKPSKTKSLFERKRASLRLSSQLGEQGFGSSAAQKKNFSEK